jgi:hypothetical protein
MRGRHSGCRAAGFLGGGPAHTAHPGRGHSAPAPRRRPAGTQDGDKRRLVRQLMGLDASYHGGLMAYIGNAKQLLRDSKEGAQGPAGQPGRGRGLRAAALLMPRAWRRTRIARRSLAVFIHCGSTQAFGGKRRGPPRLPRRPAPGRNPFDGYTPSVPEGEALDFGSDRFMELEAAGLGAVGHAAFVLVAGGLGERLGYSGAPGVGVGARGAGGAAAVCGAVLGRGP